jgi:hypothetical protein
MVWDHAWKCQLSAKYSGKIMYYDFFPIEKGPRRVVYKEYCKDAFGNCAYCKRFFSHTHHFVCLQGYSVSDIKDILNQCEQKGGCGIEFSKTYEKIGLDPGKYCLKCAADIALAHSLAPGSRIIQNGIRTTMRYAAQSAADDMVQTP